MTSESTPAPTESLTDGAVEPAGALEPLARGVVAEVTHKALSALQSEVRAARRQALREAVAAHGPSKVSAAMGISRQALGKLTRAEGTSRDRVTHRPDSSPTGGATPSAPPPDAGGWGAGTIDF
jgi:hypothetical protein